MRAAVLALVVSLAGCVEGPRDCTADLRSTPTGSIRWTDGVVRVPDRVYVFYEGYPEPHECDFNPLQSDEGAIDYNCTEGPEGSATLSVRLDRQRWDRRFHVEEEDCHALPLTIDLELDPASGQPL